MVISVAATAGTLTGQFSFDGARRATSMLVSVFGCEFEGDPAAPCVSVSIPLNIGVTSGGSVTIIGMSFGAAAATPTASLTTAEPCSSTAWASATAVACAPAAYSGSAMRKAVSVSAAAGTSIGQFSFDSAPAASFLTASFSLPVPEDALESSVV
jgi:hypothetical protein